MGYFLETPNCFKYEEKLVQEAYQKMESDIAYAQDMKADIRHQAHKKKITIKDGRKFIDKWNQFIQKCTDDFADNYGAW